MFGGIPILAYTPEALLGITVLSILAGLLVPRRQLKDKDEESERWRKAYEAERDARITADAQTAELLEIAKTTHDILDAMFNTSVGRHRTQPGGPHVVPMAK